MTSIHRQKPMRTLVVFAVIIMASGCAHSPRPWGGTTTILPGWQTFGEAAKDAIADPHTWVPIIAAGVFSTGSLDKDFTKWAVRKDLLFDSRRAAREASDDWMEASEWLVYATALAAPSGDEPLEWIVNKGQGLGATFLILKSGNQITSGFKNLEVRERPDGSNDKSFPSGHAMRTSFRVTLAARNIESMPLENYAKRILQGGAYGLAGATAWARLEANKHYPSDVLIGYSLGHFFGAFLNDAFITPATNSRVRINAGTAHDGWKLGVEGRFN